MYGPNFKLTEEIKEHLKNIDSDRETILKSLIRPKIDIFLKIKALNQSVYASTVSEEDEEPLAYNDPEILMQYTRRSMREKREKKVINYYGVLKNIEKYHDNGVITEDLILLLHKDITSGLLDETFLEGHYKIVNNKIKNEKTKEIRYIPPVPSEVPKLINDLIEWINNKSNDLHPVIVAGIVHYEIVRIHPFVDGNGRTARALTSIILFLKSFDIKKYFSLDEQYNFNRSAYADALKSADESCDLTKWLEYFAEGVSISVHNIFKMISDLPTVVDKPVELNEMQIDIVHYVFQSEKVRRVEIEKLCDLNSGEALKIIKELEDMEILKAQGKGRGTYHILDIIE